MWAERIPIFICAGYYGVLMLFGLELSNKMDLGLIFGTITNWNIDYIKYIKQIPVITNNADLLHNDQTAQIHDSLHQP